MTLQDKPLYLAIFPAFLGLCFLFTGRPRAAPSQSEFVLGTVCTVHLYKKAGPEIYQEIFSRFREIEAMMSVNSADSDISAVNNGAGIAPVRVHAEVLDVVESALRYAELSGGAFDPSVGPLVRLWNIGQDDARLPAEHEIREILPLVNWRDVVVDREAGAVFLRRPGMRLDLGGIAKGYAADEAVRIIEKYRIKSAIVDLGGNVFAYGEKPGKWPWQKLPWRIGIQNPLEDRGQYFAVMELRNKTAVTSGVYERFLEAGGRKYHHILSTQNGYPVESSLLSVTIVADRSIDADALSTAVFALGWEKGAALVESLDEKEGNGTGAIFVFDDMSVRCTRGMEDCFTLADPLYRLETNKASISKKIRESKSLRGSCKSGVSFPGIIADTKAQQAPFLFFIFS